jgi:hypothetical protein
MTVVVSCESSMDETTRPTTFATSDVGPGNGSVMKNPLVLSYVFWVDEDLVPRFVVASLVDVETLGRP